MSIAISVPDHRPIDLLPWNDIAVNLAYKLTDLTLKILRVGSPKML